MPWSACTGAPSPPWRPSGCRYASYHTVWDRQGGLATCKAACCHHTCCSPVQFLLFQAPAPDELDASHITTPFLPPQCPNLRELDLSECRLLTDAVFESLGPGSGPAGYLGAGELSPGGLSMPGSGKLNAFAGCLPSRYCASVCRVLHLPYSAILAALRQPQRRHVTHTPAARLPPPPPCSRPQAARSCACSSWPTVRVCMWLGSPLPPWRACS